MKKDISIISQLKTQAVVFSENSFQEKKHLLQECTNIKLQSKKIIELYHGTLIFLLGYPENEELYLLAKKETERLAEAVKKLPKSTKTQLERTGIPYTETQAANSLTLIKWLLKTFPNQVYLHSLDKTGIHPKEVLRHSLTQMEFEFAFTEKLNPLNWLETACGSKNKKDILIWIVNHFEKIEASDFIKDQLFESLKVFITLIPTNKVLSKCFGNFETHRQYYHPKGLLKHFDEKEIINKKLPSPKTLSDSLKNNIIEKARIALFLLNRETEPITYCNADGILFYELEHGLSIALFSILPERRLPLESYIGFMMFKNGYPMAYGGAWVFGQRALIGVNIFENFRGGESAFIFAQLLRTYKQSCGATYFEVEPYQFGKHNPEGLKSGAFWFYYRFGFRPLTNELKLLAEKESEKIHKQKGYRSPIEILKKFTESNIGAHFSRSENMINPALMSDYISKQITLRFHGNRANAEKWCYQKLNSDLNIDISKLNKNEKIGLNKLVCFIGFCLNTTQLKKEEQVKLRNFTLEKGLSEFKYIELSHTINFKSMLVKDLQHK